MMKEQQLIDIIATCLSGDSGDTEDKRECAGGIHISSTLNLETGTTITAYSESTNESMKESMMNQKPNNLSLTQRKPNNPC